MDPRARFGQNVRERRLRKAISQETLAGRTGLHRNYVGSLERGERNVALINIARLAHALDCSPAELLEGVEPLGPKALSD